MERKHRHILNVARVCLFQARLPITFWGESIFTAAHIINRTPLQSLEAKHLMRFFMGSRQCMIFFACLAAWLMLIEGAVIRISLALGVEDAYLLDTRLDRRHGTFMILRLMSFSSVGTLNFLKISFQEYRVTSMFPHLRTLRTQHLMTGSSRLPNSGEHSSLSGF